MGLALILSWNEVLHVVRDRATLAQVLLIPFIQLLILANAATFEIRDTPLYVVDQDHTSVSRGLVTRFAASGDFRIAGADRKSTRLNSSHLVISYAVFCLKKKKQHVSIRLAALIRPYEFNSLNGVSAGEYT